MSLTLGPTCQCQCHSQAAQLRRAVARCWSLAFQVSTVPYLSSKRTPQPGYPTPPAAPAKRSRPLAVRPLARNEVPGIAAARTATAYPCRKCPLVEPPLPIRCGCGVEISTLRFFKKMAMYRCIDRVFCCRRCYCRGRFFEGAERLVCRTYNHERGQTAWNTVM
jgi:hypothetical protein